MRTLLSFYERYATCDDGTIWLLHDSQWMQIAKPIPGPHSPVSFQVSYALCQDGTVWQLQGEEWLLVNDSPIPGGRTPTSFHDFMAICQDGTVWQLTQEGWLQIADPIPDSAADVAAKQEAVTALEASADASAS